MNSKSVLAMAMLSLVAACGGGGGGSDGGGGGNPPPATPQVTITGTGPTSPVGGGSSTSLDLVVSNPSTVTAANVAVALTLDSALTSTGAACTASGGATCPTDPASIEVASLPAGGSLHFSVALAVATGARGALSAAATVSADGVTASSASKLAVVIQAFMADVQVSAQAPTATLTSGANATYTMTVSNAGPDTASNLVLQDIVDSSQTLGTIVCNADGGAVCPPALGVSMTAPTLPVGGHLVFTVPATIAANSIGTVANTLYVTPNGDPAPGNNLASGTATTAVDPHGTASLVTLQSDAGDYIGAGQSYAYSNGNARLTVTQAGGQFHIAVTGNDNWTADFAEPSALTTLQRGTYANLTRYPFDDATVGGIDWSGDGRGCNTETGSFTIDSVTYSGATLTALDLHFEQHCEGAAPALRGQIHWLASDTSTAPGPTTPVPAWLWRAPAGATPATGNYVYLQSDPGDYIGAGATHEYTQANAVLQPALSAATLNIGVSGDLDWTGHFQPMSGLAQLQPGYYPNLLRSAFGNPMTGGLDWDGDGRGCNTLTGWFAIDRITVTAGVLSAIDLRFEQHCEGAGPALHGQIHWAAGDSTVPPGPQNPAPASLWQPPIGATPASGNYVYLQSDSGDYIGQGLSESYAQPTIGSSGTHLTVSAGGWTGDFVGMNSITQLEPGYYGGLERYPFENQTAGGLNWSGQGRGCNTLTGWFVIDSVTYAAGTLSAIDLRFEQHCEGATPALHGKIHWTAAGSSTSG